MVYPIIWTTPAQALTNCKGNAILTKAMGPAREGHAGKPAVHHPLDKNEVSIQVTAGKATVVGDRTQMRVPLKALSKGTYKVLWRVLSVDTHRTQGDFSFSVGQ